MLPLVRSIARLFLFSVAWIVLAGALLPLIAHAQPECIGGENCCVVASSIHAPVRYAMACDSPAQSAFITANIAGYKFLVLGPASRERCTAWLAKAGISRWEQIPNSLQSGAGPQNQSSCVQGQSCCYVGSTGDNPPRYALAYDGTVTTGNRALAAGGFNQMIYGPVSIEACTAYWNKNIAAAGLGRPIRIAQASAGAAPSPLVPRSPLPGSPGGTSLNLNPSAWLRAPNYVGAVSNSQAGLLAQGGPFTNGRLTNGVYDGNRIQSRDVIDLSSGGDLYAAFSVDGDGTYLVLWPRLLSGMRVPGFSTHHSWENSIAVPERTRLYAHLRVSAGGAYQFTVTSGAYDVFGGQVLHRGNGVLPNPAGHVDFQFADNYAGPRASLTIHEVWIYRDSSMSRR